MAKPALWDLSALLNAADPRTSAVEQHLWLVRLLQWLRAPGPSRGHADEGDDPAAGRWPAHRLRLFLDAAERDPATQARVGGQLRACFARLDATGLLADFGFAPRQGFVSELAE
ncbi:MAG: recombinase, partial [Burkholderiaceae bacterium]